MTIYTIGYEGTTIEAFIKCLRFNHIEIVMDVRQYPFSRKPGFSQKALQKALCESYIAYRHFPALGCPVEIRDRYKDNDDWQEYCKSYNAYLSSHLEALDPLMSYLPGINAALMCFEADANRCHRLLIANKLARLVAGIEINNLEPATTAKNPRQKASSAQPRMAFA